MSGVEDGDLIKAFDLLLVGTGKRHGSFFLQSLQLFSRSILLFHVVAEKASLNKLK
jgi:hypothetical protein